MKASCKFMEKSLINLNLSNNTGNVRSRNHCCSGKAINIKYYEYVFVALFIQHAIGGTVFCRIIT